MSKAAVVQFYWDADCTARETLEEYSAFEFGAEVTPDVMELVDILERTATMDVALQQPADLDAVKRAFGLAQDIDGRLPAWARDGWRWQILRQRAILDHEKLVAKSLETPAADTALRRLMEIYHAQMETDDPYHHRVRPPHRQAVSRNGCC